jgi:glutaconyl-CoA/methylmalonyl-CoA decarboxylase subunit gamma
VKFKIMIDRAEHQIDAAADGSVVVDGKAYRAKVTGSGNEKRTVQVGDKTYEVRFVRCEADQECSAGEYVLEVAGERVPVAVRDVSREVAPAAASPAAPVAAVSGPAVKAVEDYQDGVFAPVPGKIVDVKVKAGDSVKEGDLIVILEAMKMENELHASKSATVAAVLVNKGDQAAKGQLLVAFE